MADCTYTVPDLERAVIGSTGQGSATSPLWTTHGLAMSSTTRTGRTGGASTTPATFASQSPGCLTLCGCLGTPPRMSFPPNRGEVGCGDRWRG